MFCKYCGKEIKEGEICTCRQQGSKTPYPKPDIRPVMPERENTQRQGINQNQGNSQLHHKIREPEKKMGKDWQLRLFCLVFCFQLALFY